MIGKNIDIFTEKRYILAVFYKRLVIIRTILQIRAKKQFGQNFLKDRAVLHKIIQSMPKSDNIIAEIGPGLGDLTQELLKIKDVIAFEIDTSLCHLLQQKFAKEIKDKRLQLICTDVIEYWKQNLVKRRYDLVANLPYYVATNIVIKALMDEYCDTILVMLQKEVAKKFSAQEGEREFSALSVLAQSAGDVKIVCSVKPEAFSPAPKVDSAVLLIQKQKSLKDKEFMEFLKKAFSQPRKKLLKNLSSHYDKKLLESIFSTLGIASTIRPHEASTSIYHQIYAMLKEKIDGAKAVPAITK